MARAQSSFAISAAFCSMATMVRPESSAMIFGSGWLLGANGTTVAGLSAMTYPLTYFHILRLLGHAIELYHSHCGMNPKSFGASSTGLGVARIAITVSTFSPFRH